MQTSNISFKAQLEVRHAERLANLIKNKENVTHTFVDKALENIRGFSDSLHERISDEKVFPAQDRVVVEITPKDAEMPYLLSADVFYITKDPSTGKPVEKKLTLDGTVNNIIESRQHADDILEKIIRTTTTLKEGFYKQFDLDKKLDALERTIRDMFVYPKKNKQPSGDIEVGIIT